jgi:hypothetical protein
MAGSGMGSSTKEILICSTVSTRCTRYRLKRSPSLNFHTAFLSHRKNLDLHPTPIPLRHPPSSLNLPNPSSPPHPPHLEQTTRNSHSPFDPPPHLPIRSEHLRNPHPQVYRTLCGTRRRSVLRVPAVLRGTLVLGRILEV